ncbi:putative membrane protein (TIGR02234 family) [Antricoccus suffuscus]|uniref:Putative membrane protein (TIGR02234 family) n=1 Tax=Antricoccus suffuscus TaxID=1629062 RepID=A0A2T0Z6A4_9ACTN|nr:Trp biosynthesis-associated membrane protein [Antricoccus suffuscus]PRZ31698.1 putative membrane protein (TIGR02234 family) [Antricoccus suffuscus]
MKRLYSICLAGLIVAAGLIFFATSQEWVLVAVPQPAPLPSGLKSATGSGVLPGLTAVAIVLLAAVVAVAATRRMGRRLVGALVTVCGIVAVVLVVPFLTGTPASVLADVRSTGTSVESGHGTPAAYPPWLALVGALIAIVVGVAIAVRGPSWSKMGSKYEAPSAAGKPADREAPQGSEPVNHRDAWNSLDQGIDPT